MNDKLIARLPFFIILQALALLVVSCHKDDDPDEPTPEVKDNEFVVDCYESPDWNYVVSTGTDSRPDWKCSYSSYSQTMAIQLDLSGGVLMEYASENDLIAAFINGECRGVASPRLYNDFDFYFPIVIGGNVGDSNPVTLKYYSSELKRVFTASDYVNYNAAAAPARSNYDIDFYASESGLQKFYISLAHMASENFPLNPEDKIAVFDSNGNCCGESYDVRQDTLCLFAYGKPLDLCRVKYYNSSSHKIYTLEGDFYVIDDFEYKSEMKTRK
ncbi:MAG: hypothetical protein II951_04845 [Bacteroidales bacterium]|nr:hypothetical protein [Bacteroidales bacterium]